MKKPLLVTLMVGLLISLFPLGAIAAPPSQEPPCNPIAIWLEEVLGVDCTELMVYQVDGVSVGLGEIVKAYFLSDLFDLDWHAVLEMHVKEDLGWGQIVKVYTLASVLKDVSAQDLLNDRAAGLGWGEIRQKYELERGKPPWAGPPPWAHRGKPPWAGPHPTE